MQTTTRQHQQHTHLEDVLFKDFRNKNFNKITLSFECYFNAVSWHCLMPNTTIVEFRFTKTNLGLFLLHSRRAHFAAMADETMKAAVTWPVHQNTRPRWSRCLMSGTGLSQLLQRIRGLLSTMAASRAAIDVFFCCPLAVQIKMEEKQSYQSKPTLSKTFSIDNEELKKKKEEEKPLTVSVAISSDRARRGPMINALRLSHFQIENRFNDARSSAFFKPFSRNSTVALKYRAHLNLAERLASV